MNFSGGKNGENAVAVAPRGNAVALPSAQSTPAILAMPPTFRAIPNNKDLATLSAVIDTAFETTFVRALWDLQPEDFGIRPGTPSSALFDPMKALMILHTHDLHRLRQAGALERSRKLLAITARLAFAQMGKEVSSIKLEFCLPKLFLSVDFPDPYADYGVKAFPQTRQQFQKNTLYFATNDDNTTFSVRCNGFQTELSLNFIGLYLDPRCSPTNLKGKVSEYKHQIISHLESLKLKQAMNASSDLGDILETATRNIEEKVGEALRAALALAASGHASLFDYKAIQGQLNTATDYSRVVDFSRGGHFLVILLQLDATTKTRFMTHAGIDEKVFRELMEMQNAYLQQYRDFASRCEDSVSRLNNIYSDFDSAAFSKLYQACFAKLRGKNFSREFIDELLLQAQFHPQLAEPLSRVIAWSYVPENSQSVSRLSRGGPRYTLEDMVAAAYQIFHAPRKAAAPTRKEAPLAVAGAVSSSAVVVSGSSAQALVSFTSAEEVLQPIASDVVALAEERGQLIFAFKGKFESFTSVKQRAAAVTAFNRELTALQSGQSTPEETVNKLAVLCQVARAPINRHQHVLRDLMLGTQNTDTWKREFKKARLAGLKALHKVVEEKVDGVDETKKIEKLQYWRRDSLFAEHRNAGFGVIGTLRGWSKGAFGRTAAQKEIDEMIQSVTCASGTGPRK